MVPTARESGIGQEVECGHSSRDHVHNQNIQQTTEARKSDVDRYNVEHVTNTKSALDRISTNIEEIQLTSKIRASTSPTPSLVHETALQSRATRYPLPSARIARLKWTHPAIYLSFCVTFIAFITSLVVLSYLSDDRKGFAVSELSNPFVWRYLPTAILTIVIALWRQVDNSVKTSTPWLDIMKGQRAPSRTYLLDYISPILPVALYASVKNKHWRVVSTTVVFGVLKIIVVFSTGLLAFQITKLSVASHSVTLKPLIGSTRYGNDSDFYIQEVYGNLAKNLSYQPGTSKFAAFQQLSQDNIFPPKAVITADVLGFFPDLLCEDAAINFYWTNASDGMSLTNDTASTQIWTNALADFKSDTCSGTLDLLLDYNCHLSTWACASDKIYKAYSYSLHCPTSKTMSDTNSPSNAFVLAFLALSSDAGPGSSTNNPSFISWSTAAVCRPTYAIESAQLTIDTGAANPKFSESLSRPITSTQQMLQDYSSSDLTHDMDTLFVNADYRVTSALPSISTQADYSKIGSWFQLMFYDASSTQVEDFRNMTVLEQSAKHVFQSLAVQWVAPWLSFPGRLSTTASYIYEEERLYLQRQPTWEMSAGFVIVTVIGILLLLDSMKTAGFKPPSSLSAMAVIAKSDLGIDKILSDAGHLSDQQLFARMIEHRTSSKEDLSEHRRNSEKGGTINVSMDETKSSSSKSPSIRFWIPMSSTKWFATICLFVPICEVIVLEVLQYQSDRNNGFCDVTASSKISHQLVTILSALVMISTAAIFSATEWATGVIAPFSLLKRKSCRLSKVDDSDFGGIAPIALVKAVRHQQFAVSAMLLSTIIGSMLTIAVSGLFAIEASSKPYDVTAYSTTQFDTAWSGAGDLGTTNIFALIYNHNASEPIGTHGEFAFPMIELDQTDRTIARILASQNTANSFADIRVPVLRGSLNCSAVPREAISYGVKAARFSASAVSSPMSIMNVTFGLSDHCKHSSGQYQNSSQLFTTYTNPIAVILNDSWIDGSVMTLTGLGAEDINEQLFSWPQNCPSVGYVAGRFANDTSAADKTVIICTQLQEEIPATIRLNLPDLSRDTRTPVRLEESQAKVVTAYQYHFEDLLGDEPFYTTLTNVTGIKLDELIGEQNVQKMINATQYLYRLYMAQAFNSAMRVTNASSNSSSIQVGTLPLGSVLNGTIYDSSGLRIVQNRGSKIILQSFLSAMVICYITAYTKIDMRTTLPHNPCTIAGMMSLLADSKFAEEASSIAQKNGDMIEPGRQMADLKLRMGWFKKMGEDEDLRFGIDFAE